MGFINLGMEGKKETIEDVKKVTIEIRTFNLHLNK